jgi:hypothetical protein
MSKPAYYVVEDLCFTSGRANKMLKYASIFTIAAISAILIAPNIQAGEVTNTATIQSRQTQQNLSKNNGSVTQGGPKTSTSIIFSNGQQVVVPPPVKSPTPPMNSPKKN